ncbi:hypothetical protein FM076_16380 [Streptomyces albus subsp. chlorinus]|uniref:type VII secretion target n=1 Tax=Streptomyces albus TaxID=1888 RepID=UPI00156D76FF|nr:type VII secretion target [Streptomyces albus]NSC22663.1 hypothetical protein [Streptomyces albus subsp. chlorinus]
MNFEQEWARLKADAEQRQDTHMQLAGYGPDAHGRGLLHVSAKLLRDRAGDAEKVATSFGKADNSAIKETGQVEKGLSGFKSASAFATFEHRWEAQVKHVKSLLRDGLADALRNAADAFKNTDHAAKHEVDKLGARRHR